ncbi:conserved protein of unknown function [Pseudodesulfovibrio profundus]|uniref:Uncharacterized protein n=1 Tax=Pseudodesulfovibrio profundus TaxID=57320 RepID=A0A2C8F7G3_9BACT|nr:hypothetical protein [Pseudodesulfovibrio profundus]SOB58335.1 conserved protein of unknown function [Pseudodesulfovibrio profundus]
MKRRSPLIRVLKPIVAGMALAFFVTAFLDRPAPVHFQPENPYAPKQSEVARPQTDQVMDTNVLRLGSPLSVQPSTGVNSNGEPGEVEVRKTVQPPEENIEEL